MHKYASFTTPDPPPPRRRWLGALATILAGLAASPLVYESALLCAANWRAMQGGSPYASTPVLDALGGHLTRTSDWLGWTVGSYFHAIPWRPEVVIGIGSAWVAIAR